MNILEDDAWIDSPRKVTHYSCNGRREINSEPQSTAALVDVQNCTDCKGTFTAVIRKHQCKQCGGAFCAKCSSNYSSAEVKRERSCIKCASKGLLLRRKAKPSKSAVKSIVVKSMKADKFEKWDDLTAENIAPMINVPSAPSPTESAVTKQVETKIEARSNNRQDDHTEEEETESLIVKPSEPIDLEEASEIPDQGFLCIVPPSVFSFMFGE